MRDLKLFTLLTIINLIAPCVFAQPDTLWSARITTTGNPAIYQAIDHSSGDIILIGETNPGLANSNFLMSRLSSTGAVMWTRSYGSSTSDAAYSGIEIPGGDIITVGSGNGGDTLLIMAISAAGDSLWSRYYARGGLTCAYDVRPLQDGNMAITGYRLGPDNLHSDLWLLKCNTSGDTLWTRTYGGSDIDIGYRIREKPDRSLLIGGYSKTNSAGDYDMWLMHTDSAGNLLSSSLYGGTGADLCYDLANGDNGIYLAGKTANAGRNIGYVAKTDENGDSLWIRSITAGGMEEQFRGLVPRRSGGVLCAGWTGPSWNGRQCWLAAINSDGSQEWQWIHGPLASGFYGILNLSSGGYLLYGQITELNIRKGYAVRIFISEIRGTVVEDATGVPVEGARVGILGTPLYAITDQHGSYRLGVTNGTYDLTVSGACIARDTLPNVVVPRDSISIANYRVGRPLYAQFQTSINAVVHNHVQTSVPFQIANLGNGVMEFGITPAPISPPGRWLSVTPDTGLISPGDTLTVQVEFTSDTTDTHDYDFFGTLHLTTNSCPGNSVTVPIMAYVLDAAQNTVTVPRSFSLTAFPNPFNPSTTISFTVPQLAWMKIAIYNISGRLVTVLAEESFAPGVHRVAFDGRSNPSGIYFVRIESASYNSVYKIMLLK